MRHFHACAREGLNGYFIVVLFGAFGFRQQVPKLCGFSAFQARLTFADDLDHTDTGKSQSNRVCRLVVQLLNYISILAKRIVIFRLAALFACLFPARRRSVKPIGALRVD